MYIEITFPWDKPEDYLLERDFDDSLCTISEFLSSYIQDQFCKDKDPNKLEERDTYHIKIEYYPGASPLGLFVVTESDTGNKDLTNGIVMTALAIHRDRRRSA